MSHTEHDSLKGSLGDKLPTQEYCHPVPSECLRTVRGHCCGVMLYPCGDYLAGPAYRAAFVYKPKAQAHVEPQFFADRLEHARELIRPVEDFELGDVGQRPWF